MEKIILFLKECIEKSMYGTIEIRLEAGKIISVRKIESVKIN